MKKQPTTKSVEVREFHAFLADMYDRLAARMVSALYQERDKAVRELGLPELPPKKKSPKRNPNKRNA